MRQDILRDETGDLAFVNGDFFVSQSNQQHIEDIIDLQLGELKEFPLAGFGAINYIKRTITADEFKRDLKIQLNYDGYNNVVIDTSKGIENLRIEI
ncbi:hypothetical protein [Flavobacterium columnare]|uniref:Oxidase n=1 Tax=Flavobacterium columnare TaxID=996 RepID=A0AAI8CFW3_9FLAO|nr:hypothetical protein [Flavobacterium columnare]AMO19231.1 hypothetical protein UN65_01645 [Flavobacterium columnare]AUX17166.1 hypothetical protein AQ623_01710 [Flavobacterium columnare]QOG56182.1 hypothetical protein HUE29_01660 [Flavobacterium columnare]QOG58905.1 hypothetical protein HUE30_01660 [Flavobacterium columnare]QOG61627.1 hypothetical protein HUE31_01665 [Flavobacterium columnare]